MQSRITTGGRITLPKKLRATLGIEPGDKVKFAIDSNGHVILRAKPITSDSLSASKRSSLPKRHR
jgi:antitoxin PrlF